MAIEICFVAIYIVGVLICSIIFPKICPYNPNEYNDRRFFNWYTKPKSEYCKEIGYSIMMWPLITIFIVILLIKHFLLKRK